MKPLRSYMKEEAKYAIQNKHPVYQLVEQRDRDGLQVYIEDDPYNRASRVRLEVILSLDHHLMGPISDQLGLAP
jgi:hypothetical protein